MQYKHLGTTGMAVSAFCMGTMTFGREASAEESKAMFDLAREAGINFIDTANIYSNGGSEALVGEFLQDCRDEWILATKATYPMDPKGPNDRGSSRRHLRMQVEASLKRLKTDRIELFYLHGFDPHTTLEETMRVLDDLVREGKILSLGVSNFAAWQVMKAQGIAMARGYSPIQAIQPMYSLVKRQVEVELLPMAQSENIAVVPYSPLGAGVLTGKYVQRNKHAESSRLNESDMYARRYGVDGYQETARQFVEVAQDLGVRPAALAIAWVAAHPGVTAPILGARNITQLEQSLEALSIEITPELYQQIASLSPTPPPATDRLEEMH